MNYVDYFRSWYSESLTRQSLRVVVEPTTEQISIVEARAHLRLDAYGSPEYHPDDDMIEQIFIPAAREYCEIFSGRSMVAQTFELGLGAFPRDTNYYNRNAIPIPVGPVIGVTSFVYTDGTGVEVTLVESVDYNVDKWTDAGYIYPVPGGYWPTAQETPNAVRIQFIAGYSEPSASPQDRILPRRYKSAMLLMLGHLYENRSNTEVKDIPTPIALGMKSLLEADSLRNGFA